MKTKLIIAGIVGALALGGAAYFGADEKVTLDTATAQQIVWDKPKTDAEWAEDVKQESFHIKSTGVLEEMKESHEMKLLRQEKYFKKFSDMVRAGQDPIQYLFWEERESLEKVYEKMGEDWLNNEANHQAQAKYHNMIFEIEKLKQSIERMDKEIELRDKGFVVVEGEEGLFGGFIDEKYVRKIND